MLRFVWFVGRRRKCALYCSKIVRSRFAFGWLTIHRYDDGTSWTFSPIRRKRTRVALTRPNRFGAVSRTSIRCIRKYAARSTAETSSLRRINVTPWQSPPVGPMGAKVLPVLHMRELFWKQRVENVRGMIKDKCSVFLHLNEHSNVLIFHSAFPLHNSQCGKQIFEKNRPAYEDSN